MIFDQGTWRPNGKYKYGGGVVAEDGAIYCFPSDVALDTIIGMDGMLVEDLLKVPKPPPPEKKIAGLY